MSFGELIVGVIALRLRHFSGINVYRLFLPTKKRSNYERKDSRTMKRKTDLDGIDDVTQRLDAAEGASHARHT